MHFSHRNCVNVLYVNTPLLFLIEILLLLEKVQVAVSTKKTLLASTEVSGWC